VTTIASDYFQRAALRSYSHAASDHRYLAEVWHMTMAGNAASTLPARAFSDLARVVYECCIDGWDGYGAKAISEHTIERISGFLSALPIWMSAPDVVPEADGEIAIEWHVAPDRILSISIGETGPLHFAGQLGPDEEVQGTAHFTGKIPQTILRFISGVLSGPSDCRIA
jgi:hypothetical protein